MGRKAIPVMQFPVRRVVIAKEEALIFHQPVALFALLPYISIKDVEGLDPAIEIEGAEVDSGSDYVLSKTPDKFLTDTGCLLSEIIVARLAVEAQPTKRKPVKNVNCVLGHEAAMAIKYMAAAPSKYIAYTANLMLVISSMS
ncbi:hypothetical protein U1Q18_030841 [Sarracenia purpurea var. burkii]